MYRTWKIGWKDNTINTDWKDYARSKMKLTAMQERIEKLETAASQAVAWLNYYPSPDNIEEQAESNRRRALNVLEKALTK